MVSSGRFLGPPSVRAAPGGSLAARGLAWAGSVWIRQAPGVSDSTEGSMDGL